MKYVALVLTAISLTLCAGSAHAAPPILLTKDTTAVADLSGTDLVKKNDLLDCYLRLEGSAPHYKLVYSLGEIEIPTDAVKKDFDHYFFLVSVKASISGIPVSEILVPYNKQPGKPYSPRGSILLNGVPREQGGYQLTAAKPERDVLMALRGRYQKEQIVDHSQWDGLAQGGVMIRSHPNPGLFVGSMDPLGGPANRKHTFLYYICVTDKVN